ncbi:alpha/beta hydrolase [Candidatus Nomurabacteria bacterium]|nr:alpha/beta hydrolase [Candidatus Nomurabacteria bacterium]MCB9820899.1 alpha/beta hydrolase [Candidatus Nomurabacteria bacterium]
MKKVYIIHGWEANPNQHWLPWLGRELQDKGFEIFIPEMPNTEEPDIDSWVERLKELVGTPDQNTYFVGHSIGCQTIMRYLESLPERSKIGGIVFVAGWFYLENLESPEVEKIAEPWLNIPIDTDKVKGVCSRINVLLSDDDYFGCIEKNKLAFEQRLNAKVDIYHNYGHFCEDDGKFELPEALEAVLKIVEENRK